MSADARHQSATGRNPNRQLLIFLKITDTKRCGVDVQLPPFHFPDNRIITETGIAVPDLVAGCIMSHARE